MTAHRRTRSTLLLVLAGILAAATLAGCGQTGPLTLPGAADQSTGGAEGTDNADSTDGDDAEDREENER